MDHRVVYGFDQRTGLPVEPTEEPAQAGNGAGGWIWYEDPIAQAPGLAPTLEHPTGPAAVPYRPTGTDWGAAWWGWLAGGALGVLLVAALGAAGAALGIDELEAIAGRTRAPIEALGGAILGLVALLSLFASGYVAGRMTQFDGHRQGAAVWTLAAGAALVIAASAVLLDRELSLVGEVHLHDRPLSDEALLVAGGALALALIALTTRLAAVLGGRFGERYRLRLEGLVHAAEADETSPPLRG